MKQSTTSLFLFTLMILFITLWNISCKKEKLLAPEQVQEQIASKAAKSQSSLSHTKKYSSDVANEWFSLLASTTRTNRYPPAPSIRIFAYSSI
ncbi:MAG: hypothetical protein ACR2KX_14105, partial [Chitinophagaceae bacterium]